MSKEIFSLFINDRPYELTRANNIVYLYREPEHQDMDHLVILDHESKEATTVYRLPDLCRYMAGMAFKGTGTVIPKNAERQTFEEVHGWFADSYIQDKADDDVIEAFARLDAAHDIGEDGSWSFEDED